mmetsp:Transcript_16824/g.55033  ORF Transcript_16824/g.55033 Transcript_16824/m.55033 type:complete len:355 (+) Transcript_16824:161-1225(+)
MEGPGEARGGGYGGGQVSLGGCVRGGKTGGGAEQGSKGEYRVSDDGSEFAGAVSDGGVRAAVRGAVRAVWAVWGCVGDDSERVDALGVLRLLPLGGRVAIVRSGAVLYGGGAAGGGEGADARGARAVARGAAGAAGGHRRHRGADAHARGGGAAGRRDERGAGAAARGGERAREPGGFGGADRARRAEALAQGAAARQGGHAADAPERAYPAGGVGGARAAAADDGADAEGADARARRPREGAPAQRGHGPDAGPRRAAGGGGRPPLAARAPRRAFREQHARPRRAHQPRPDAAPGVGAPQPVRRRHARDGAHQNRRGGPLRARGQAPAGGGRGAHRRGAAPGAADGGERAPPP